jgi:toxin HigB-1
MLIQSFGNASTEDFFHGRNTAAARKIPAEIRKRLERKLDALNAVVGLEELGMIPGNNLERLKGREAGFHSIRINDQWRIKFRWTPVGPADVQWMDYH